MFNGVKTTFNDVHVPEVSLTAFTANVIWRREEYDKVVFNFAKQNFFFGRCFLSFHKNFRLKR